MPFFDVYFALQSILIAVSIIYTAKRLKRKIRRFRGQKNTIDKKDGL